MAEGGGDEKASGSTPTVFISYASQDVAVANAVVEALECHGAKCWIAPRDVVPGEFYSGAIVHAIDAAKVIVLVLSENAATSQHVLREVERASSKRHPVVAFRIDLAPMPAELEYFLNTSHWLDASAVGVEHALPKLVDAVQRAMAVVPVAGDTGVAAKLVANLTQPRPITRPASHRLNRAVLALSVLIALGLGYFAADKLWFSKRTASERPVVAVAPTAAPAAPAIPEKSVAVLPFIDMSEKKDQEYFSDGLSEELIDMLTKIPDLRVPARTSSFYFKGKSEDIPTIARRLMVAHVLEGSVRKYGNHLRVTAQLVRADSGYHLWSETYDRQLNDVFKVQDEIAVAVVKALRTSLLDKTKPQNVVTDDARPLITTQEDIRPQAVLSTSADAYTHYLQARSSFQRGTKDDPETAQVDYETALDYLYQALKLDPSFAAAWAEVAKVRVRQVMSRFIPVRQASEEARQSAERALALNSRMPAAYLSMGSVHYVFDWNWPAAEAEFKKAIELEPRNPDALRWAAHVATTLGHFDEAVKLAKMAIELDPLEVLNYRVIGGVYYRTGRYADADAAWRTMRALNPALFQEDDMLALTYLARGEPAAALAAHARAPRNNWDNWYQAMAYHALGRRRESDAALARFVDLQSDESAIYVAEIYAYRGEIAEALTWLERGYERRDDDLRFIKGDPFLRNLERDSRYRAFLRKMNLAE
jgi:TolB-like protein/Tfp pilus assembly protein PilF